MTQEQTLGATLAQPVEVPALPNPDDPRYFPSAFDEHLDKVAYGANEEIARDYIRRDIARGREIVQILSPWSSIRGMDVLDIGCGYGGLLIVTREAGAKTISGIEVDAGRLHWATLRLSALGYPASFQQADICDRAILASLGTYDLILAQDVLEHVSDPSAAIHNISRLLRPGGVVYVQVGNKFSPDQLLGDHHYHLPGITLLSRPQAIEYCQTRLGIAPTDYAVGFWREEKFYRNVFHAAGVALQRIDHYETPNHVLFFAEAISKMCTRLESDLWPDLRPELARRMRRRMRKIAELYVHASRQLPSIESRPELLAQACDAVVGRLLACVWRLAGVKHPAPLNADPSRPCAKQSDLSSSAISATATPTEKPSTKNILLIHEIIPHFDCSGADLRLFELVREIIAQGHRLTFLARDGRDYDRYAPPLQALGATVVSDDPDRMRHIGNDHRTPWSLQDLLERDQFDFAILSHWFWSSISVAEHYIDDVRRFSPASRILVLSEDRHGERERRSWRLTHLLSDLERGNDFEQREMEIYARADLVLYVTETDQRHFLSLQPALQTEHLPTIAETGTLGGPFHEREGVLFLGNFDNLANRDALQWLLREAWPFVAKAAPGIKLYVAGHAADPSLAKDHPEVTFLGKVPDLAPAFAVRRVFAAPIRYGTGIITKNMHALAHGLPLVTTSVGAEGMQLVHEKHALIFDDPKTFADGIVRLHNDELLWGTISRQGGEFIRSKFSLANLQSQIRRILIRATEIQPQPFERGHTWSYRAVEESNPEVLAEQPVAYRGLLRLLAYWQRGIQCLDRNQPAEALREFRHVFTLVRGRLSDVVIFSRLLQDMSRAYRQLHDPQSASLCDLEAQHLVSGSKKRLPAKASRNGKKKSHRGALELSVVIPTYNRIDKLRLCLAALAFQTLPANRWEVIIIDDGSTPDTESFCRNLHLPYPNLRYIRQENRGAGAARRLGVETASGEILLVCNDDTIADNRLLAEHLRIHREHPHEKWAVLGDFFPSDDTAARALSFFVNVSEFFFPQKTLKPRQLYDQAYFVTCNLSIRRDAVLAAGNFDPEFRVAEDTELGTRLVQRGYRVYYHPDAIAWHEHARFTTDDLIHRAQRYGVADWALFRKHPHLLGNGAGVFGTLTADDQIRMQQLVDSNQDAVEAALIGLRALDDIDFRALVHNSKDKGQTGKDTMRQMTKVVPLVYWHHLFETFLQEWQAAKNPDRHSLVPTEQTQGVEVP